jgi:hypothetical protein
LWRVLRPRRWSRYQFATNLVRLSFVWRHMAPSVSSFGCALLSAECASPAQLENGGSIVNISSILGLRTGGRVSAYAASKACGRHRALLCGQPTEPAAYWPAWQDKSVPSHGSGLTAASSAPGTGSPLSHRCGPGSGRSHPPHADLGAGVGAAQDSGGPPDLIRTAGFRRRAGTHGTHGTH